MNKAKLIAIIFFGIIWNSSTSQNKSDYQTLNKSKCDSAFSFFKLFDNGIDLKSTTYENKWVSIYPNTYHFVVKKTKTEYYDYQIDGTTPKIEVSIFDISNDSITIYAEFITKEDDLEILKGNKLIYKTKSNCRGGDGFVHKLVDIEDQIPFAIYNFEGHCFKLQSGNEIRWISFYYTSDTGISSWIKEDNGILSSDSVRYLKSWSIIYSNEDNFFEVIDAYEPYPQESKNVLKEVTLSGLANNQRSLQFPNYYYLLGENIGFNNFSIKMSFDEHIVEFPINDKDISIEDIQINGVILKKRKIK